MLGSAGQSPAHRREKRWKFSQREDLHWMEGGITAETCCVCCAQLLSRARLFATLWTVAGQALLTMGFSRPEYWSGLPCPPPGDLPNPGIKPRSPELQADSLPFEQKSGLLQFCSFVVLAKYIFKQIHQRFIKYQKIPVKKCFVFKNTNTHRHRYALKVKIK